MDHLNQIVETVEARRSYLGMSVAELARRAHIDGRRLRRVLNGERVMSADELVRVCAALGVRFAALAPEDEAAKHKRDR